MSNTVVCQGCKKEIPTGSVDAEAKAANVGEIMKAAGCEIVVHLDTSVGWLCPDCTTRILPHIKAILDILGDERDGTRSRGQFAYWNSLPHILKRQRIAAANKAEDMFP